MSSDKIQYDYIIAGAGCAGLSLAARMASQEVLRAKRILLVDKEEKKSNDRTWCFWEREAGFFESTVHKSWEALDFVSPTVNRRLDIKPYRYKMIRSADFYKHCSDIISSNRNIERLTHPVESFRNEGEGVVVIAGGKEFTAEYLFNSTLNGIDFSRGEHIFLRQHFRGWIIRTEQSVFDPSVARLMDFRTSQKHGTAFFYTLPLSAHRALVEYTLFTRDVLSSSEYTQRLAEYIQSFISRENYEIEEEENGVIPMTNYPFERRNRNIINIGTAGGQTKASTGYTFQFIQRACDQIVSSLAKELLVPASIPSRTGRFAAYDSILLRVLDKSETTGANLFSEIFRATKSTTILKFLDNQSTLAEEAGIMWSMPKKAFLSAAIREIFR